MHSSVSLTVVLLLLTGTARAATPAYDLLDLGPLATPYEDEVFLNDYGQTVFNNPAGAFGTPMGSVERSSQRVGQAASTTVDRCRCLPA